jgi:hypothetical protein
MKMILKKIADVQSGPVSVIVYRDTEMLLCIEAINACTKPDSRMIIKTNRPKIINTFIDYELSQWLDEADLEFIKERINEELEFII